MTPITTSDLVFSPLANHNFSKTLGDLKRHTLSISNRLSSVLVDADFVQRVASAYARPLIANERCGSWYIDPARKNGSAYFKSTDGHTGVWKFSTRRLNTHLLKEIGLHDGCIIVDSTRRGKSRSLQSCTGYDLTDAGMPDALSKTIPIWCCVLNRALFPDEVDYHNLYYPPQVVSPTEYGQMLSRMEVFLKSFLALGLDVSTLRNQVRKPLRPMWVTPDSEIVDTATIFEDFHPVICCTASRRVAGGELSEGGYIQGSGDDTENWAHGLTPPIFWANKALLLSTPEAELPQLIQQLAAGSVPAAVDGHITPLAPTTSLYICSAIALPTPLPARSILVSLSAQSTPPSTWSQSATHLAVGLGPHKLGSRALRTALDPVVTFVAEKASSAIYITCTSGTDHSVGVGLALLCIFFSEDGMLLEQPMTGSVDKNFIRRRLGWIMVARPEVNPSRSTLQSVNSFLMERPG